MSNHGSETNGCTETEMLALEIPPCFCAEGALRAAVRRMRLSQTMVAVMYCVPPHLAPAPSPTYTRQVSTPGVVPPSVEPVPLSPHLKTLLELKAQDAVSSLSIVYVPETATVVPSATTTSRADSVAAAGAEAEVGAAAQADESGSERGDRGSAVAGEAHLRSTREAAEAEKAETASAAGVYVAAGLETGVVEVLRLSSRREGTRVFDLVRASERSDQLSPSQETAAAFRPVDEGPDVGEASGDSLSQAVSGDYGANERPRAAETGTGERGSSSQVVGMVGDRAARLRLDREEAGLAERSFPPGATTAAAAAATAGPMASALCGWHVPAECNSPESWAGRGLVVGFSDTGLGNAPFDRMPRTPLDRSFGKAPRWGWGKAGDSAGGRSGWRGTRGGDEQQVFAVCTMDGCVRCCQVVSTAEGQPRWKKVWTRQTKASRCVQPGDCRIAP